ncbi:hypothetical protein M2298_003879 [Brevibacillus sp. 1238]|nr:hypothetical protein [Brevibacillus sp. 1238]
MKQGKRPTNRQKDVMTAKKLNPANWLVERDSMTELVLIHRYTGTKKTIKKGA